MQKSQICFPSCPSLTSRSPPPKETRPALRPPEKKQLARPSLTPAAALSNASPPLLFSSPASGQAALPRLPKPRARSHGVGDRGARGHHHHNHRRRRRGACGSGGERSGAVEGGRAAEGRRVHGGGVRRSGEAAAAGGGGGPAGRGARRARLPRAPVGRPQQPRRRRAVHPRDVNAVDHTGQTALHWSSVRGHVQVAELLLKEGAKVDAADLYGYQSTHVAAQYGQTAFIYHVVAKWNADPDVPDNDGRSPLHWAAYKGFADSIRLLLYLDAYRVRQDKEGCTPLHWAAIRGNMEACTVLVQAGKKDDLMVKDKTGLTPAQLAADKNHRQVAFFLDNARRVHDRGCNGNATFAKLSKLGLAPVLWCIAIVLLATYIHSVIAGQYIMDMTAPFALFAWSGVFLATAGLIMFYRCSRKDPGYISANIRDSQNQRDDEPLLKLELDDPALLAGNWSQLCITCKIVRPVRSKHCSTCDRCVEQFDHHCPWVSNCIGKKNKWDFFMFITLEVFAMIITGSAAIIRTVRDPASPASFGAWLGYSAVHHPGAVSFFFMDLFLFCGVAGLTVVQASQIARNITTNEMVNSMRYSYLRGPGGRFRNPFDHGVRKNCADFLLNGYNEDVERLEHTSHTDEEIGMIQMTSAVSQNGEGSSHHVDHACVDSHGSSNSQSQVSSSQCCDHSKKNDRTPFGLGLGLGRNSASRQYVRSLLPL